MKKIKSVGVLAFVAVACATVGPMARMYYGLPGTGVQAVITPDKSAMMVWTEETPKPQGCGRDPYCLRTRLHQVPDTPAQWHEALDRNMMDLIEQINLVRYWNHIDPKNRDCVGMYAEYWPRDGRDFTSHWNPEDGRCRNF